VLAGEIPNIENRGVVVDAAAVKAWLLDQIRKRRSAPAADVKETVPEEPIARERLPA
jgi:hypothetical protein